MKARTLLIAAWLVLTAGVLVPLGAQTNSARFGRINMPNGTNSERLFFRWLTNVAEIGVEANGGTNRFMRMIVPSGQTFRVSADGNSNDHLTVSTSGISTSVGFFDTANGGGLFIAGGAAAFRRDSSSGEARVVAGSSVRLRVDPSADAISVGAGNVSTTGSVRLLSGGLVAARNAANNGNLFLVEANSSDELVLGHDGTSATSTKTILAGAERSGDPTAPASNGFKLFAKDNGSGRTQLCVRFATGATQCFATEP